MDEGRRVAGVTVTGVVTPAAAFEFEGRPLPPPPVAPPPLPTAGTVPPLTAPFFTGFEPFGGGGSNSISSFGMDSN